MPAPRPRPAARRPPVDVDVDALAAELERTIDGEVRFDPGSRHLYATDASNFRQVPLGVVLPRTVDDVVATVTLCRRHGAPITTRGGGTSLAGQACNVAVVIDCSRYLDGIVDLDVAGRTATVRPGLVLDDLRTRLRPHDLTWGPSPSTHNRCTVGGMLGNNACGTHAFAFGRAGDNVEQLDVLLYDGTRMTVGATPEDELDATVAAGGRRGEVHRRLRDLRDRYAGEIRRRSPDIPRRVSGYDLVHLLPEHGFHVARALVGTEGTCVVILGARLRLNPLPPARVLAVLGYEDVDAAGRAVPDVRHAEGLYALEGIDHHVIDAVAEHGAHLPALADLPDGRGWLLCELRGRTADEALAHGRALLEDLDRRGHRCTRHLYGGERAQEEVWTAREIGLGVTAHARGQHHWPGWEDSAVHPDRVGDYLDGLRALFDEHGFDPSVYGHFGDGCVHCRLPFDLATDEGIATYRRFVERAADLVVAHGGSLSGEHGDGQQRGELLERMYGPELVQAMREFKAVWDPDGRMNPGKVVDAGRLDQDLRLADLHRQWRPETRFAYPRDGYDWNRAQLRCVGVGTCRRDDGAGTMCPSYMVTKEEMHSTRGRARLLFEMLQPDSQLDGWRDEHVREALELCLSCKGCTTDCPANVDLPTYKAEFLHHHYRGRLHPPAHYALGWIDVWSRLAQRAPGLVNAALGAPVLSGAVKRVLGIAPQRPAPRYAARSFRAWFERRGPVNARAEPVLLFADTFTDHFRPEVGRAAVEVLEDAGYRVILSPDRLCCGRPLYDFGFLDRAERYLDRLLAALGPTVDRGATIVGLEPSCVAVLRDELLQLVPDDPVARRVAASTRLLSEFLVEVGYDPPRLHRRAIVHGHCHHKGAIGMQAQAAALDAMGLDWVELDAGCCGLAGAFGFEAGDRFQVSVAAGERKLLPAVRAADRATLILADGFSCATQIEHLQRLNGGAGRRALHLAQVIRLGQRWGPEGPPGPGPVEGAVTSDEAAGPGAWGAAAAVGALAAGAAGFRWLRRR